MMGILLIVLLLVMVGIEVRSIVDKLFPPNNYDDLYFQKVNTNFIYAPLPPRTRPSSKTS